MKIPEFKILRKDAGYKFRPAERYGRVVADLLAEDGTRIGVMEVFDTLMQERTTALVVQFEDGSVTPVALVHNGNLKNRVIPCCGVIDQDYKTNNLTPEEWDLLPCKIDVEES